MEVGDHGVDQLKLVAGQDEQARQREAIRNRDWLTMLKLGGNIYYTFKLAAHDGLSMQDVGAKMSGVSTEEFKAMLLAGGRRHDG